MTCHQQKCRAKIKPAAHTANGLISMISLWSDTKSKSIHVFFTGTVHWQYHREKHYTATPIGIPTGAIFTFFGVSPEYGKAVRMEIK
jgi:hypothetical protein